MPLSDSCAVMTPSRGLVQPVPHARPKAGRFVETSTVKWLRQAFAVLQATSPEAAAHLAYVLLTRPPRVAERPWQASLRERAAQDTLPFGRGHLALYGWGSGPTVLLVHGWGARGTHLGKMVMPLVAAGYSLGGNFALRLALRAPAAGLPLARVAAVCPLVDPAATMDAMERGMPQYLRYFEHKWRRSLQRKRELFPEEHDFDDATLRLRMRDLTAWLVERHTDFADLGAYFDGYSIAGDRLAALQVPADILMAADDPVIPLRHFRELRPGGEVRLELARHGGHCGFLENRRFDGYAERWVAERLAAQGAAGPGLH